MTNQDKLFTLYNEIKDRPLRIIVAGGREFNSNTKMIKALNSLHLKDDTELVTGMARGADQLGKSLWDLLGNTIYEYPADWNTYGKSAGYIRNSDMAKFADCLAAFWDGKSKGTKHMISIMERMGKPVFLFKY